MSGSLSGWEHGETNWNVQSYTEDDGKIYRVF